MADHTELVVLLTSLRTGGPASNPRLHKPLLVALLLARYIHSGRETATYEEVVDPMQQLIERFDPASSSSPRPVYPFWRLQSDGIWSIRNAEEVPVTAAGDPSPRSLTSEHYGSWTPTALAMLRNGGAQTALQAVLDRYFATENHSELLELLEGFAH